MIPAPRNRPREKKGKKKKKGERKKKKRERKKCLSFQPNVLVICLVRGGTRITRVPGAHSLSFHIRQEQFGGVRARTSAVDPSLMAPICPKFSTDRGKHIYRRWLAHPQQALEECASLCCTWKLVLGVHCLQGNGAVSALGRLDLIFTFCNFRSRKTNYSLKPFVRQVIKFALYTGKLN